MYYTYIVNDVSIVLGVYRNILYFLYPLNKNFSLIRFLKRIDEYVPMLVCMYVCITFSFCIYHVFVFIKHKEEREKIALSLHV